MKRYILIRHGESEWNREGRLTGWCDIPLSCHGREQISTAAHRLKEMGIHIDRCYSSALNRAIESAQIILNELSISLEVTKLEDLNENHYGVFHGVKRDSISRLFGHKVAISLFYDYRYTPPPIYIGDTPYNIYTTDKLLTKPNPFYSESYYHQNSRVLRAMKKIIRDTPEDSTSLIVAHGNTIREIIKDYANISDKDITSVSIPNAGMITLVISSSS